jgi:hypothetical protein
MSVEKCLVVSHTIAGKKVELKRAIPKEEMEAAAEAAGSSGGGAGAGAGFAYPIMGPPAAVAAGWSPSRGPSGGGAYFQVPHGYVPVPHAVPAPYSPVAVPFAAAAGSPMRGSAAGGQSPARAAGRGTSGGGSGGGGGGMGDHFVPYMPPYYGYTQAAWYHPAYGYMPVPYYLGGMGGWPAAAGSHHGPQQAPMMMPRQQHGVGPRGGGSAGGRGPRLPPNMAQLGQQLGRVQLGREEGGAPIAPASREVDERARDQRRGASPAQGKPPQQQPQNLPCQPPQQQHQQPQQQFSRQLQEGQNP